MSEQGLVNNDLKIMVQGTEHRVVLKDKKGVDHVLQPLDLSDMCEYEARLGQSLLTANLAALHLKDIIFLLYLSLRKEGLSYEEIDRGAFKLTEKDVQRMFDLGMVAKSAELFLDLLRVSGFEFKQEGEKGNPQKAN
jgi:hypothetical protein